MLCGYKIRLHQAEESFKLHHHHFKEEEDHQLLQHHPRLSLLVQILKEVLLNLNQRKNLDQIQVTCLLLRSLLHLLHHLLLWSHLHLHQNQNLRFLNQSLRFLKQSLRSQNQLMIVLQILRLMIQVLLGTNHQQLHQLQQLHHHHQLQQPHHPQHLLKLSLQVLI